MEASIITQVSREDEQLSSFPPPDRGNLTLRKSKKSIFRTLFCCCVSPQNAVPSQGTNGTCVPEDVPHLSTAPVGTSQVQLLPPVSHCDMHKICMVIDLDETLVHSSFKPITNADFVVPVEMEGTVHQVYVLKRPYVDDFLQKMGELYECVLFTASLAKYADPVADLLDKRRVFRARLFRESCVLHKGNYVKDLSRLGRDLHKVVIVDNSPVSYIFHHSNAVPVSSWFEDMTDSVLSDLIPFLETLSKVDNVYSVLANCNNPLGTLPVNNQLNSVIPRSIASYQIQHQGPITQVQPPPTALQPLAQQNNNTCNQLATSNGANDNTDSAPDGPS